MGFQISKHAMQMNLNRIFGSNYGTSSNMVFGCNIADGSVTSTSRRNRLEIFKGTVPTPEQIKNAASGLNLNRAADSLIIINGLDLIPTANIVKNTIKIAQSTFANANATGTATWFMMWSGISGSSATINSTCLVGDISDLSGNGALRIQNVNIVAGTPYSLHAMAITIPHSFP